MKKQMATISGLVFVLGLSLSQTAQADVSCNEPYFLIKGVLVKDTSKGLQEGLPASGTFQVRDIKSNKLIGLIPPGFKRTYREEAIKDLDKLVGKEIYGCVDEDPALIPEGTEFKLAILAAFTAANP